MNGARSVFETAASAGVELCLANPGTTEMPLVAALDEVPEIRAVLALFEGVCTGAADGYARMMNRPALTLLHLGPGFANGIANLHNARRAYSPVVNLIGDHATWHLEYDAPLTSDIDSLARPVSRWVQTSHEAGELGADTAAAIEASLSGERGVATLVLPADLQAAPSGGPIRFVAPKAPVATSNEVALAAMRLRDAESPVLLLGGRALRANALPHAARIAAATGARLVSEVFPAHWERGAGLPVLERMPYFPEQAIEFLAPHDAVLLAGATRPVAFFGYEGTPSELAPTGSEHVAFGPEHDATASLAAIADALDAPAAEIVSAPAPGVPAEEPSAAITPGSLGGWLARLLPEAAIVVDEGATSSLPFSICSAGAAQHSLLGLTGGAIGQGLPVATGAALACPTRKVVALQADGSAAYTLQSLWTIARETLDVVTLLCSNRAYRILQIELARAGIAKPGPKAQALTTLDSPTLDWCSLARGFGIPADRTVCVATNEELAAALERAFSEAGPHFIEVTL